MAWADLTITREDIDSVESETFRDLNVGSPSTLGISEKDGLTLDRAKNQLYSDVTDRVRDIVNQGEFDSLDAILDALEENDDKGLLKDLLLYRFLEIWLRGDSTYTDSKAYESSIIYNNLYHDYLDKNVRTLAGTLDDPQRVERIRMRSTYA